MLVNDPELHGRDARATRAFTMVEILVVVIILAIAAAIVVPMAINTGDLQAASGAQMLTADLQYAQNMAITTQQPVTVTFNATANSYTLSNASGTLIHPIKKTAYVVDFDTTDGLSNLRLISASFASAPTVTFDELGAPNNAGVVTLRAGASILRVNVAAATGRITVTAAGS
ncbi:MAG: GspH/FimT family protein [Planctomycetaceae bacterium]